MKPSPEPPDPLDEPSGVSIMVASATGGQVEKELTFRELREECAKGMRDMDQAGPRARIEIQRAMDPAYRPLAPYEGLKRSRGMLRRA
jgi:hypothetical protein